MNPNTFKFSVKPSFDFDTGVIQLEMSQQFGDLQEQISTATLQTRDEAIHKALVALGWTPPPEIPVEDKEGHHHFLVLVKNQNSRKSAETDLLYAFASRQPDSSKFYIQR